MGCSDDFKGGSTSYAEPYVEDRPNIAFLVIFIEFSRNEIVTLSYHHKVN